MPFKSDAQRRFMYAQHPRIAARWSEHTPKGKDLPEHVKKAVEAATIKLAPMPASPPLAPAVAIAAAPTIAKLKAQAAYKLGAEAVGRYLKHQDDPDSNFLPDQLAKGIEVEREHSESLPVRKAITKGHLAEFDRYYDPLAKMEEKLKEGKTAAYSLGIHRAITSLKRGK